MCDMRTLYSKVDFWGCRWMRNERCNPYPFHPTPLSYRIWQSLPSFRLPVCCVVSGLRIISRLSLPVVCPLLPSLRSTVLPLSISPTYLPFLAILPPSCGLSVALSVVSHLSACRQSRLYCWVVGVSGRLALPIGSIAGSPVGFRWGCLRSVVGCVVCGLSAEYSDL